MVWGFGGFGRFGRLVGGDDDDQGPQKLSNSDRHAAVMAEAAALGLMDTKPAAPRREKPPEVQSAEDKKTPKAQRFATSEPSGESSRHADSPASEEVPKVKKKKKKGKHRHSELPGELSASEASPHVKTDFGTSWPSGGLGDFGGAGFGDATSFGFGGGFETHQMGPSDYADNAWGQSPEVLEQPPVTASRRSPRQMQPQVLEQPPVAASRRSPRQMQSQDFRSHPQDWMTGAAASASRAHTAVQSPMSRSSVDLSWALPTRPGPASSPRKAVDISWAMRPQPARVLRRMASREEMKEMQAPKDEREVAASQRALAEEAALAAAAKTLAQAEEVSRRRDELVERLAQEIKDLKEKLNAVNTGPVPGVQTVQSSMNGHTWPTESWEELPREGAEANAGSWGDTSKSIRSHKDPQDRGKHRKDKESRRSRPAGDWPQQEAETWTPSMSQSWEFPSGIESRENQMQSFGEMRSTPMQRQRSGSGDAKSTPMMRRVSGELKSTPTLQRNGSDMASGFGEMRSTPMQRQRSGSGDAKSTPMMRRASGDLKSTPALQRNGSDMASGFGEMRSTPMPRQRSGGDQPLEAPNDEVWVIDEDRLEKYRSVFARADLDGDGLVQPSEARDVLLKSNLPEEELAQIYGLADVDKDGQLNLGEFCCALHLAYKRSKEGFLPTELPKPLLALASQTSSEEWSVKTEELGHYLQSFHSLDPHGRGIVGQDEGKDIFERSGLPVQELSFIWQLADRDGDGSLVFPEFAMAMAMVARRRRGWSLPSSLPVALVRSVESFRPNGSGSTSVPNWSVSANELEGYRSIFQRVKTAGTPGTADLTAAKALLEKSQLPVSELSSIYAMSDLDHDGLLAESEFLCAMAMAARRRQGAPLPEQLPQELREACWENEADDAKAMWQPRMEELSRFQQLFIQLQDHGFVSAERAREVLESSGLPLNDLAKIWDLADAGDDGKLDLGEFCCAMSLSARRREGAELPQSLPDELLPLLRLQDLNAEMQRYSAMFDEQVPPGATMPADRAREILEMSELPASELAEIWRLSGVVDALNRPVFLQLMALTARRRQGQVMPTSMPMELVLAAQLV